MTKPTPVEDQLHHFLPQSYLNAWIGEDDKLSRYAKGRSGAISVKRYAPPSVARMMNLYSLTGFGIDMKQIIETRFMQRIDHDLVEPLELLTNMTIPEEISTRLKWSKFVSSLYFRMPEVVAAFDEYFTLNWLDAATQHAVMNKDLGLSRDDIVSHYRDADPTAADYWARVVFTYNIEHSPEILRVLDLQWKVLNFIGGDNPLMTSDCPLMVDRIDDDGPHCLALAIAPSHMFMAYRQEQDFNRMLGPSADDLIERYNGHVVSRARDVVIAYDHSGHSEVKALMSTVRSPLAT